ncbi:MAG: cytidine deaminase [Lachnospiraceae bacterium]|nr:cytidine deaminase [Lachnospiraceae bacterium]
MGDNYSNMVRIAIKARKNSYSPYSGFKVGACLKDINGNFYTGCNIENAAFSPTNCAERTAFFKAVSEGVKEFESIAIAGGVFGIKDYCPPCGVCRQVMMEFCNPESFKIILAKSENDYKEMLLKDLLPEGFGRLNVK